MPNPSLPVDVVDFVDRIVRRCSRKRKTRNEVRRELLGHFEDALEGVPDEDRPETIQQLKDTFGAPDIVAKLIRRGKQRCRPLWESLALGAAGYSFAAVLFAFLFALAASQQAQVQYEATVQQLQGDGTLRKVEQIRSTRPAGTAFFNGPRDECATVLLLTFDDTSWSHNLVSLFEALPNLDAQKEQEVRSLIASHENRLNQLRHVADLPPTPMAQILQAVSFTQPTLTRVPTEVVSYVRLLLLNAFLLNRDGHPNEALAECDRALSVAAHLRDIPMTVVQALAEGCEKDTARILEFVSMSNGLSREAMAAFGKNWDPCSTREALAQAMEAELEIARWLEHETNTFWPGRYQPERLFYVSPVGRFIGVPKALSYYTYKSEVAQCLRLPFYEAKPMVFQLADSTTQQKYSQIATRDMRLIWHTASIEAQLAQARIALALNLYKAETGRYPKTLDELAPNFLETVPLDPFSGKPMAYTLVNGEYRLYSVGPDQQDNIASLDSSDDIVWGFQTTSSDNEIYGRFL